MRLTSGLAQAIEPLQVARVHRDSKAVTNGRGGVSDDAPASGGQPVSALQNVVGEIGGPRDLDRGGPRRGDAQPSLRHKDQVGHRNLPNVPAGPTGGAIPYNLSVGGNLE